MISLQNKMIDLRYSYYLYMSDMMSHMIHHGNTYKRRNRCSNSITLIDSSNRILDMVNKIHKEVMVRDNDFGDSLVSGSKLVKEIFEFLVFILIFILTISIGTLLSIGIVGVVFLMYLWDTSKYFWKSIKNT